MTTSPGNKLFQADRDWWNNACLNFTPDQWDIYAEGYKLAADILANHVVSKREHQDILVYPIVFNYRQFIELRLKHILTLGAKLHSHDFSLPTHHEIDKTWADVRKIILKVWPTTPKKDLDAIEKLIKEFAKTDRISMVFRYPVNTKGMPSLPEEMRHINLRKLCDLMKEISQLLDGAAFGIDQSLNP
jgi:hypothetical protein